MEMESCCILLAGLELCRPDYPQTILPLHSRTGTTRHSLCRLFIIANPSVSVSEENVKSMISFNLQSNTAKYRSPTVKPFPADTKSKVSDIGLLSVLSEESFQLVIPKPGLFLCSWLYSEKAVLKDTRMWMSSFAKRGEAPPGSCPGPASSAGFGAAASSPRLAACPAPPERLACPAGHALLSSPPALVGPGRRLGCLRAGRRLGGRVSAGRDPRGGWRRAWPRALVRVSRPAFPSRGPRPPRCGEGPCGSVCRRGWRAG